MEAPPTEPGRAAGARDATRPVVHRLHPLSWLFVLVTRLRPFVVPIVLLLFFGLGSSWELWGLLGAVVVAGWALIYSLGFRYHLADGELVVREGVLFRTERHIPLARVQSIVQRRNALHRVFGVAELRLESSGGTRPEAVMNVIPLAEAERLERVLRSAAGARELPAGAADAAAGEGTAPRAANAHATGPHATGPHSTDPHATGPHATGTPVAASPGTADDDTLFALSTPELLRFGLIQQRGWIVVGMAAGLWWQFAPEEHGLSRMVGRFLSAGFQLWRGDPDQALRGLGLLLLGLLGLAVVIKPLSIALTALMFGGFRLRSVDGRLSTKCGLLTERSASARAERIQRLVFRAPLLARAMGRSTLCCDVAVQRQEEDTDELARLHWLLPIGTPERIDALVRRLSPALTLGARTWRPLHASTRHRLFKHYWIVAAIVALALCWFLEHWTWVPVIAIVAWGWFLARGWARFSAWSHHDGVLAWRAGWPPREWTTARVRDGHVVVLRESPFDRRRGTASLALDTAGAADSLFPLRIPYLPVAEARTARDEIARELVRELERESARERR